MKKILCLGIFLSLIVTLFSSCSGVKNVEEMSTGERESATVTEEESATATAVQTTGALTSAVQTTAASTTVAATETTTVGTTAATTAQAATTVPTATKVQTTAAPGGSFSSSDLSVSIHGTTLRLNKSYNSVSSSLGTPLSTTDAPSCHYDGMDTIYQYNGFSIYTYATENDSIIYDIEITSPSIATTKGVAVGDTVDKVLSVYGNDYAAKTGSTIEYRAGSASLYFSLNGDTVSMIEYYSE